MYNQKVFERFISHENAGFIKKADGIGVFKSKEGKEELKIYLKIENGVIKDAKFKIFGGVSAIVSADAGMDLIKDKKVDEALLVSEENIDLCLGGLPEGKTQSAENVVLAIAVAVKNYRKKLIKLALKNDD